MILLAAVVGGLLAGLAYARWHGASYRAPELRSVWLVLLGFLPQLLIAYLPASRHLIPDALAAAGLWASSALFLAFVWLNRRLPGMPLLLAGLILNLAVMAANGGWMPISPQTASQVLRDDVSRYVALNARFGQKDMLLQAQDTHLGFLADRFLFPSWFPYQVAFSAGDILIAAGVFWLLARPPTQTLQPQPE